MVLKGDEVDDGVGLPSSHWTYRFEHLNLGKYWICICANTSVCVRKIASLAASYSSYVAWPSALKNAVTAVCESVAILSSGLRR